MVGLEDVAAVLGTYLLFAAFLSLTTHLAARNVLGDVRADRALQVGPLTAAVPFPFLLLLGAIPGIPRSIAPVAIVPTALAVAVTAIRRVYDLEWKLAGYVVLVQAVLSVGIAFVLWQLSILLFGG